MEENEAADPAFVGLFDAGGVMFDVDVAADTSISSG